MKNLLSICIPTYKRPATLRRCIESVVSQVDAAGLSVSVELFVANDASPDNTSAVLRDYAELDYFTGINRAQNLGMNVNIRTMFEEVSKRSEYQLILTDDDYLQADSLTDIVEFLQGLRDRGVDAPVIWTPRYSYTDEGALYRVFCNPFKADKAVGPGAYDAGRYMENGFVLSGLFWRGQEIDLEFWRQYSENAYFPMICSGEMIFRQGGYYWHRSIAHHTVLNECHWESWGENDIVIEIKLFTDFVNAYAVMASRIGSGTGKLSFYFASFRAVYGAVKRLIACEKWIGNETLLLDTIRKFKAQNIPQFGFVLRSIMLCAFLLNLVSASLRPLARLKRKILAQEARVTGSRMHPAAASWYGLKTAPTILRLILSPPH